MRNVCEVRGDTCMPRFSIEQLTELGLSIFRAVGAPDNEAQIVTELLVKANLTGHDSHGVLRIPEYVRAVREGRIKPGAKVEVAAETPSTASINGNWGFGQVVATRSMEVALDKATNTGIGAVGVLNCNHVGRLADYTMMALAHDMIGIMVTNSFPLVAPFGGIDRMLNPSPISVAIPTGTAKPFVLDISTGAVAEGKVRVKMRRGEKVPLGWIIDKDGKPTDDPADFYRGGAILPLGGNLGYKGFGLGLFIDLMSGALTGVGCASSKEFKGGNGVFAIVVNIACFTPVERFKERVDNAIQAIKLSKKAPGFTEILIPGEPELAEEERRLREGIFIEDETWRQISATARELGVATTLDG